MCNQSLLAPINQCPHTGNETNATPLDTRHHLKIYLDCFGRTRMVSIHDGQPIAAILLSKASGKRRTIEHTFTLPAYRKKGNMGKLISYAKLTFGQSNVVWEN